MIMCSRRRNNFSRYSFVVSNAHSAHPLRIIDNELSVTYPRCRDKKYLTTSNFNSCTLCIRSCGMWITAYTWTNSQCKFIRYFSRGKIRKLFVLNHREHENRSVIHGRSKDSRLHKSFYFDHRLRRAIVFSRSRNDKAKEPRKCKSFDCVCVRQRSARARGLCAKR